MISGALIDWQPMQVMPGDRRDGRAVLLWSGFPWVAYWIHSGEPGAPEWALTKPVTDSVFLPSAPTFWADINPPPYPRKTV